MKLQSQICLFVALITSLAFVVAYHPKANAKPTKATKESSAGKQTKTPKRSTASKADDRQSSDAKLKQEAINALALANVYAEEMSSCEAVATGIDRWISANEIANFMGSRIGQKLEDLDLEKGEFETTEAFNTRMNQVLSVYVGNPDRALFRIPISESEQQYDADSGTLSIGINEIGTVDTEYVVESVERKIRSNVQGQTVHGIKFKYDVYSSLTTSLTFVGDEINRPLLEYLAGLSLLRREIKLKLDPIKAMALEDSLELIIFGALTAPFFEESVSRQIPSLDMQSDRVYWT